MGFFGKMFEKKVCAICGAEIGMLGNRKLEDGNMCKECEAKLSPWFNERRSSTVKQIEEQLAYREENKQAVAVFRTTRSLGKYTKVLLDEDAGNFVVTSARDLVEANPDVLSFSQVTGCELKIEEDSTEEMTEDKDGRSVSYNPPRYTYSYDFDIMIRVNHPYFDEISFRLNSSSVETTNGIAVPANRKPIPTRSMEYKEYARIGQEIKEILTTGWQKAREKEIAAAAPKVTINCPYCGAPTIPDDAGCCEYCGSALEV